MSLKNKEIVSLEKKVLMKVPECSDEKTEMTESIPYSFRKNFFFCNFASNLWREDILTLLYCFVKQILLNIEMKKIFTFAALLCATWMNAQGVYQIPNSDFEGEWKTQTRQKYTETTPESWNSFYKAQGSATGLAFMFSGQIGPLSKAPEAHSGNGAALITSAKNMLGTISNGNLTTGIINMGSSTADHPENYNFSDMSSETGSCKFAGFPDAVRFWVKFDSKDVSKGNASANMVLHTDAGYSDPSTRMGVEAEAASRIAKAYQEITPNNSWKEYVVPFVYNENNLYQSYRGQKYLLVSFSTNKTPGVGSDGDALAIDDIQMIYYSELASLNYDGQDYFQKGNTNYTIDALYDESKLTCTSNGRGATIEKSYYDEASAVLTITVKGNDISVNPSNVHTYKVQFAKPQPVITEYENDLLVALNNQSMPSQPAKIQLIKEIDGTTSLALNNFVLGSGEDALPVGNIKLTNLEIKDGKIQATQDIRITAGDDPAYGEEEWIGPGISAEQPVPVKLDATILADNKMEAVIDIPLAPGFMEVKVTFAETQTYTDGQALSLNTGLTNIAYNRTFPEGWSTVCLPFATPAVAFGDNATSVQEFVSADESGLNFAEVETLEANKPYLIYFAAAKETPTYFGTEITSTTPVSVTKGDYTFVGSYDAVMSMSGKYGIATVDDVQKIILGGTNSTLKATRAYFTKKGEQPAQVRINLFGMGGDGEGTTGIDQIVNGGAQTYDVYTLQGVQVLKGAASLNGLQKGVYIVNGKKVVIK
jgi:hypothetical protein